MAQSPALGCGRADSGLAHTTSRSRVRAPLLAIKSADDLINPPELGILEREIKRVARGRAIVIPLSPETHGHQSHTYAALWKNDLLELLAASAN